jgi:hypothetical protein
MTRLLALAGLAALGFVAAGCESDHAVSLGPALRQTTSTASAGAAIGSPLALEVWFTRNGHLVSAWRAHPVTPGVAAAAVSELLAGVSEPERLSGITTAIPDGTRLLGVSIKRGVATVNLTSEYQSGGGSLAMQLRLGQVVYTVTQFPTVKRVRFELDGAPVNVFSSEGIVLGHPVGRRDYADLATTAASLAGTWRRLPKAPFAVDAALASVWTGKELLVSGLTGAGPGGNLQQAVAAAAAYDPATRTWHRLAAPPKINTACRTSAAWTGKDMLVWGCDLVAFNPQTNRWRRLPRPPTRQGIVVWTGRELIGWGGGCCGDVSSDGSAYNPATNTWRKLAPAPVGGQQSPVGAWTGRELVIVNGSGPDGQPVGGAAYNPRRNTWRRIARLPAPRNGANAVWDGHELLVVGGSASGIASVPAVGLAYDPAVNQWRRLPQMPSGRLGAAAVWTGKRVLLWGGQTVRAGSELTAPYGLAYDVARNHWSPLPEAPLAGRDSVAAAWTGRELIVWGGVIGTPVGTAHAGAYPKYLADGAAFRPATP